jgi:hypothetical protein
MSSAGCSDVSCRLPSGDVVTYEVKQGDRVQHLQMFVADLLRLRHSRVNVLLCGDMLVSDFELEWLVENVVDIYVHEDASVEKCSLGERNPALVLPCCCRPSCVTTSTQIYLVRGCGLLVGYFWGDAECETDVQCICGAGIRVSISNRDIKACPACL